MMDAAWVQAIAESVGAGAALVATGAATFAGVYARRAFLTQDLALVEQRKALVDQQELLAIEMGRRVDEVEAASRAQANLVSAWMDPDGSLTVSNASAALIYSVRAWVHLARRPDPVYAVDIIKFVRPATEGTHRKSLRDVAEREWRDWLRTRSGARPEVLVEFTFRDSANQWWHRDRHGFLEPTTESGAALHEKRASQVAG